jgi:hypothetical protein
MCSSPEHTKNRQNKTEDLLQRFSGVSQALSRRFAGHLLDISNCLSIDAKDFPH